MEFVLRTSYLVLILLAAITATADVRPTPRTLLPTPTLAPPPPEYLYCWLLDDDGMLLVAYTIGTCETDARPCYRTWSIWSGQWETWQDWRWRLAYRTPIGDLVELARRRDVGRGESGVRSRATREVQWP